MLSNRHESNDSSQLKSTRNAGSRFARHLESIPQIEQTLCFTEKSVVAIQPIPRPTDKFLFTSTEIVLDNRYKTN